MSDNRVAGRRLIDLAERGDLDNLLVGHGVRVAVLFGSASDPTVLEPGDLDIGIVPGPAGLDVLGLLDALAELSGSGAIDLVDLSRASVVLRSDALVGIPLFEDRPGRFVDEQTRALGERVSTAWLRRLDLELMAG